VPEYGRSYLDAVGFTLDEEAFITIARGHRASEEALARHANRVLFSDTECLTTKMWSSELIGHLPELVEHMARENRYDLYLVTAATDSWVEDVHRFQPEIDARKAFETRCIGLLSNMGKRYLRLDGDWLQREEQAAASVANLLSSGPNESGGPAK